MTPRFDCREPVACEELQTFLPCVLGKGHQREHVPDSAHRKRLAVTLLLRYRRALESIAADYTGPCARIAREALSLEGGQA